MPIVLVVASMMSLSFNSSVLSAPLAQAVISPQDVWMSKLHNCENVDNIPKIIDSNDYYSYGKYEYQMATWLKYSKLFGTTKENISDDALQDTVTRYILDNGGWRNWLICGGRVAKRLGAYPASSV